MEEELLRSFDREVVARGYANRSEAIRDLIRERLIRDKWRRGGRVVGVIALVYDHRVRGLEERITDIQHHFSGEVISSMHVHLDSDHCLEVIAVRGEARRIRELTLRLLGLKGVKHGDLIATAGVEEGKGTP